MKNFLYMDDLPDPKKDPEFWTTVQSEGFKNAVNFLIINEIRKYDPEKVGDLASSVQLAKIKALQELLDFPAAIISKDEKPLSSDELDA